MWGLENVSHKNLDIWVLGIKLSKEIYKLTEQFPDCEKFGITSQLKRASVSIPANIAEGAARQTDKEFLNFYILQEAQFQRLIPFWWCVWN